MTNPTGNNYIPPQFGSEDKTFYDLKLILTTSTIHALYIT